MGDDCFAASFKLVEEMLRGEGMPEAFFRKNEARRVAVGVTLRVYLDSLIGDGAVACFDGFYRYAGPVWLRLVNEALDSKAGLPLSETRGEAGARRITLEQTVWQYVQALILGGFVEKRGGAYHKA